MEIREGLTFDDLLLLTAKLFESHPEPRERYQTQFSHLLLDEYQDTNETQYRKGKVRRRGKRNGSGELGA